MIFVGVLFACKTNYIIKGVVTDENFKGKNVFLQNSQMKNVDTAVIINSKFLFRGKADSTPLHYIVLSESSDSKKFTRVPILIEPGRFSVKLDSFITIKGTPTNEAYTDLRSKKRAFTAQKNELEKKYKKMKSSRVNPDSLKKIENMYEEVEKESVLSDFDFIFKNINNELGKYLFTISSSKFTMKQQRELLDKADEEFKSRERIKRLLQQIFNLENVAEGKKFTDFTLTDPNGKNVSLSDYAGKGKFVLISFWASWCGPCHYEMPYVVSDYNKYKNRGFEIVSVSLDVDKDRWLKGIEKLKMTWPQISDLKSFKSDVAILYGINALPNSVLLDREGLIIGKKILGDSLSKKLAELMGE